MNKSTINIFIVVVITAITKLLGLVKQIVIANYYGMTADTDAFMLISGTINDIGIAIFSALSIVFLTDFIKRKSASGDTNLFASNVLAFFCLVLLFVVVLMEVFAPQVVKLIAPGFSEETTVLSTKFVYLLSPMLIVLCVRTILNSILDAEKQFWYGKSLGAFQSVVIIVLTIIFYQTGIYVLVVGLVIAYILEVLVGLIITIKHNYFRIVPPQNLWNDETRTLLIYMLPLFLSNSVSEVNAMVARGVCSNFGEGVVTSLSYAQTLKQFVNSILISSTLTVLYTSMVAKSVEANSRKQLSEYVSNSILIYIIILVPVTIVTLFCATDIVSLIFGHGAATDNAIQNTTEALMGYAFGFIPIAMSGVVLRVYYSHSNTTYPLVCSVITVAINVVLILTLSKSIGIMGVSLAASVSTLVSFILLICNIRKYIDRIRFNTISKTVGKISIATIGAIVIELIAKRFMDVVPVVSLLINFILVFGVFYSILYMLKTEELNFLIERMTPNRLKHKKQ